MTLNKTTFRKTCLKKLRESSSHNRYYKDAKLNKKLLDVLKKANGRRILFYYPLDMEADIRKVMQKVRKNNEVFIPFMVEQSFKMVPFRLPLHRKKFNIYEAGNTLRNIKTIDIAVVPAVGVDGNLQRVGFGKGMYDRFFAKLRKKPYIIFTQPELCYTKELICDAYDVGCDLLITPKKIINKIVRN